ncbi:MAG: YbaN family protein [Candidatus Eisenbacteria bacterium]
MINHRARKWLLLPAGVLAVGLGIAGAFVPLLPTTPFLLLAAACFARSSDKHYEWLMNHRWLGAHIRNYREHKATTKRVKVVTLALLWGSIGYAVIVVADGWAVRALLLSVAVGVTIHVLSLRVVAGDVTPEVAATDDRRGGRAVSVSVEKPGFTERSADRGQAN